MEFGGWFLTHRSDEQLIALARRAALACESVRIEAEPAGLNLFLHIQMA